MAQNGLPTLSELTPEQIQYLSRTPAGKPPAGVIPNLSDPPTNMEPLYVVSSILLALSIIFAFTRVFQKVKVTQKVTVDDCMFSAQNHSKWTAIWMTDSW